MNNLHNASLLRRSLPRYLVVPRSMYPGDERKAHHDSLAATLRTTQAIKRATTQAKRKATLERKKAQKAAAENESESGGEDGGILEDVEAIVDDGNHAESSRGKKRSRQT